MIIWSYKWHVSRETESHLYKYWRYIKSKELLILSVEERRLEIIVKVIRDIINIWIWEVLLRAQILICDNAAETTSWRSQTYLSCKWILGIVRDRKARGSKARLLVKVIASMCIIWWHAEVQSTCKEIHLISLATNFRQIILFSSIGASAWKRNRAFTTTRSYHLENWFRLRLSFKLIRIINKARIELLKLLKLDKPSLISESFLS